jgi:GNAT superfamily N-acetyltransferase
MIRLATQDDVNRIAEIDVFTCRWAYKDFVAHQILFNETLVKNRINNINNWINIDDYVYVYEDDDKIVKGFMGTAECEDLDKQDAYELHFLYIEPTFSRNGIGSALLKYFEERGIILEHKEFVVWVLEENNIGRNFYEKHEYRPDGNQKIFKRFNKKEIRYRKALMDSGVEYI